MPFEFDQIVSNMTSWVSSNIMLVIFISVSILAVGFIQSIIYIVQLVLSIIELFKLQIRNRETQTWWLVNSDISPPISLLIPAYNESVVICDSVHSALSLHYPLYEVVVINDGSTDNSLEKLIDEFSLFPAVRTFDYLVPCEKIKQIYRSKIYDNLVVIDKENGGKADALNAGVNLSRYPVFCTVDADSLIEPSALAKAVQPFVEEPELTIAVGGTVRVLNGCTIENGVITQARLPKKLLGRFQVIEYIRAFLMGRIAWGSLGILTIVSGAFSLLSREAVMEVGGFRSERIGEDYDLIMRMHRHMRKEKRKYRISFVAEPMVWTQVPEDLRSLRSQRVRWQQGALEVFFDNIDMLFNPRYGKLGFLAFPSALIFDIIGPFAELIGYVLIPLLYAIGAVSLEVMLAFFGLFFFSGITVSVLSLIIEGNSAKSFRYPLSLLKLLGLAILENCGYRQLNNFWRLVGWVKFLRHDSKWGILKRSKVIGQEGAAKPTRP